MPIFWTNILLDLHFCDTKLFGPKLSWAQNSSWIQYFLDQNLFWIQNFILTQILFDPKFLKQIFFWPNTFWAHNIFGHKISLHPNFLNLSGWFFMNQPKFNKQNHTIFLGFDSIEINLFFFAKLSFNFNYNLVESWDSINFIFNTHPPNHPTTHPPTHPAAGKV